VYSLQHHVLTQNIQIKHTFNTFSKQNKSTYLHITPSPSDNVIEFALGFASAFACVFNCFSVGDDDDAAKGGGEDAEEEEKETDLALTFGGEVTV
jgi:hypothetical protein